MKRILSIILSVSLLAGMIVPGGMVSRAEEKPTGIIVDNKEIQDSDKTGKWNKGSSRAGKYGEDYLTSLGEEGKETSIIWRPDIKEKGLYTVWYQIPNTDAGASDVENQAEYEIVCSGKTDTQVVNQRGQGGRWNLLGYYLFNEGSDGYVKLNAKKHVGRNVHTFADAIKFQPVAVGTDKTYEELRTLIGSMPESQETYTDDSWNNLQAELMAAGGIKETDSVSVTGLAFDRLLTAWKELKKDVWQVKDIIIDNQDIAPEDKVGVWDKGSSRTGKYGDDYISSRTEGSSVTWRPGIVRAGTYNVYIQIPDSASGATDIEAYATYEIISEKGMDTLTVDQRGNGGKWILLGRYRFGEGTDSAVRLLVKETSNRNSMADAVKFQMADIVVDDKQFTMTDGWQRVSDDQAYGSGYARTEMDGAAAESSIHSVGSGYYTVDYEVTDGMDDFSMTGSLKIGDTSFEINRGQLGISNEIGAVCLEEGKEYSVEMKFNGMGAGYLDAVKLNHTLFEKYYEGFYQPESIEDWTVSGAAAENGRLTVENGEAHIERNSWENVAVETELTVEKLGASGTFGMILSGTNNSYLRLIFDSQSGKLILKEDYGDTDEPLAVSEETLNISEGQHFPVKVVFAYPDLIVSVSGKEMLRTGYGRNGSLGYYAGDSMISVNYMGVQESDGKGQASGNYIVNIDEPRQTIWGLGIEIQSDSIGSGNNGLPESQIRSVPYGINQSERDRLYEDMLKGFRYLRMAGGLYYRGTDEEGKHLKERWDTQDEELAELIEKSGIEGIDFEFWSPTPYFKASGKYTEPKSNSGLKCFSKDFTGDRQAFLEEFANTVAEDLRIMDDHGIPVVQFGLQNEAPHNVSTYSHCHYDPQEYYETMKVLVPRLRKEFPDIHIQADSWKGQYSAGSKLIIEDGELLKDIDGWTHHKIGTNSNDQINNKEYYMTNKGRDDIVVYNNEFEYFTGATDYNCINTAQSLMNWMVFEESPTWHWLHALKPFGNSEAGGFALGFFHPYDYEEDETIPKGYEHVEKGEWEYNYRNWNSVRGFLKYMPWNSIRYDVTEDEVRKDQRIMSWQTPEGRQVIALTNRSDDNYFTFNIDTGLDSDQWKGYRYTPTDKEEILLREMSGTSIHPVLPPLSIEFWVQEGTHEVPERGIRMEKESEEVLIGESLQLNVEILPADASIPGVTWSSSDKDVAVVDRDGKVTGLSEGTTVIKATRKDGGYFATCTVTVLNSVNKKYAIAVDPNAEVVITASPSDAARKGETVSVDVTGIPEGMQVVNLVVTTTSGGGVGVSSVTGDMPKETWRYTFTMPGEPVFIMAEIGLGEETRLRGYLKDLLQVVESYISGREDLFTEETMADLKKAMERAGEILDEENADKKDLKEAYDFLTKAQKNLEKVQEEEKEEEYLLFVVGSEAVVTASPSDAVRAGTKVTLDISDIPEGKEITQVTVATSSDAVKKLPVKEVTEDLPEDIKARYTFKMPAHDVFVFVTLKEIKNEVLDRLRRLIQIAEFYLEHEDEYTEETVGALKERLYESMEAADDPDCDEAEWKETHKKLLEEIKNLERAVTDDDFYLVELKKVVKESDKLDKKVYTEESWKGFADALKAAKKVLESGDSSFDEVRKAYEVLENAKDGLELKKKGDSSYSSVRTVDTSGTWILEAAGWRYRLPDGRYASDCWQQVHGVWYRFGTDSYMITGWVNDSAYSGWFYLDSTGAMVTGWQMIDGVWYYFNPVSDGNRGRMLADTVTPDGYPVGADGSLIQ